MQVVYSVVGGPSRDKLLVCKNTSERLHFICRDSMGRLDEFDLTIVGDLRQDGAAYRWLFSASDTSGSTWNMSYDTRDQSGNMFRVPDFSV